MGYSGNFTIISEIMALAPTKGVIRPPFPIHRDALQFIQKLQGHFQKQPGVLYCPRYQWGWRGGGGRGELRSSEKGHQNGEGLAGSHWKVVQVD